MLTKRQSINIKKKLLENNLKQVDIARDLSITRQQLNNILNCKVENLKLEERILDYVKQLRKK